MNILVTGGAGFIGSNLCYSLTSREDYNIIVLDNLSVGSLDNLSDILGRIEFIKGDIRDYELLSKLISRIDVVINLAAIVSVPYSMEHPREVFEVNTLSVLNIINAMRRYNVSKLIHISTCAIYGEARYLPIDEEHPKNPLSPYAVSKLAAEELIKIYSREYGFKAIILRLFNVYGPRQGGGEYSGVIKIFIERLLKGKPPVIYGDGLQTRDFIYVDDVSSIIIKALEYEPDENYIILNVGSGKAVRIKDLADKLIKMINPGIKPIYSSPRSGDIRHSQADISKLIKTLGYKPKYTLDEGLAKTIEYYKSMVER